MTKAREVFLSARVPASLQARLQAAARREARSVSAIVRLAVERYLNRRAS